MPYDDIIKIINIALNFAAIPVLRMLFVLNKDITDLRSTITNMVAELRLSLIKDFVTKDQLEERLKLERMINGKIENRKREKIVIEE